MKRTAILILMLTCGWAVAQDGSISNKFSAGFHIAQYHRDFALGIDVTSPFFAHRHIGIRLRGNMQYYEHENSSNHMTWSPYANISAGIIGIGGMINDNIRLYGEGGSMLILPSKSFSSQTLVVGGYGLFGFEFYMMRNFNYHIEIGGAGSGAVADKIARHPIYSNGLIVQAGFRTHF